MLCMNYNSKAKIMKMIIDINTTVENYIKNDYFNFNKASNNFNSNFNHISNIFKNDFSLLKTKKFNRKCTFTEFLVYSCEIMSLITALT